MVFLGLNILLKVCRRCPHCSWGGAEGGVLRNICEHDRCCQAVPKLKATPGSLPNPAMIQATSVSCTNVFVWNSQEE